MKPEYKKKWITALRSGQYKQGKHKLRKEDNYCCLGVLCDVVREELGAKWDESYYENVVGFGKRWHFTLGSAKDSSIPLFIVADHVGLESRNPEILYNGHQYSLAYLNDDEDLTFEQIADIIEAQL